MADLIPTPTRIALLRDISDGLVHGDNAGDAYLDERLAPFHDPMTAGRWKVTAAVRIQERAGWIEVGPERQYRPTEVGRTLLARDNSPSQGGAA